jgi:hypothetical protein
MVEPREIGHADWSIQEEAKHEKQKERIQNWVEGQIIERARCVTRIEELSNQDVDMEEVLEERDVIDVDILDESDYGLVTFSGIDIPREVLSSTGEDFGGFYLVDGWASIPDFSNTSIKFEGEFEVQDELKQLKKRMAKNLRRDTLHVDNLERNRWWTGDARRPLMTYILHYRGIARQFVMVFPIYFKDKEDRLRKLIMKARELQPGKLEQFISKVFDSSSHNNREEN